MAVMLRSDRWGNLASVRLIARTPYPALRATFPRKGERYFVDERGSAPRGGRRVTIPGRKPAAAPGSPSRAQLARYARFALPCGRTAITFAPNRRPKERSQHGGGDGIHTFVAALCVAALPAGPVLAQTVDGPTVNWKLA